MADIKVDPDKLDALARDLGRLRAEFAGLKDRVADYEAAVGHRKLADELESTATNWSKKRDKLLEDLDELAAMATDAAAHYRDLDSRMATAISQGPA